MENFEPDQIKNNHPTFTGVWIPAEIMLDERLKAVDKILYAEIASYGVNGCYRKRDELMQRLGVKERAFNASAKRLRECGYISEQRCFGRVVRKSTLGFAKSPNNTAKTSEKIKNDKTPKKDTKRAKTAEKTPNSGNSVKVEIVKREDDVENKRNKAIDMMFDYWKQELGFEQKQSKANRYACYNMLRAKDKGKNWIGEMIVYLKMAKADKFSGIKINNYADLQRDYEKLYGWATSKIAQMKSETIITSDTEDWLK